MPMAREGSAAGDELYRRLQLSLLLRIIMVTFLLGATVVIHFSRTSSFLTVPLIALYILSGFTYFITLVSVIALRWIKRLNPFAFSQIIWEVLFATALIYITTGKYESIFSFLYLVTIIIAGIIQYRRGAFLAATLSSSLYGLLLAGFEYGFIPDLLGEYESVGIDILYGYFVNLAAMFGMAGLTSYLTEKLRVTGDELKETLKDRDALEALNDHIVHSLSSGIITLDLQGRITSFNEAAKDILDVSDQSKPKTDSEREFYQLFEPIRSQTTPDAISRHELIWESPHRGRRYLEMRVSPLKGANRELTGTLVIMDDVTELNEMEQKLRKADRLAAIGQLAAGMAHEIRNPLASISGAIQMLDHELELDQTSHRLMRIAIRETDRLNSLITDFLLFARPTPRCIEKFHLDRLIRDLVETYLHRPDIPSGIEWNLEIEEFLEMESDPKLLEQVYWNLINNAVQAMPQGGKLSIRAVAVDSQRLKDNHGSEKQGDNRAMARLEVEDSGVGIPAEFRDRIFDPFFTLRENGTGLGLSTVYRIVESLEGSIEVKDAEGGGTKFVIILPQQSTFPHEIENIEKAAGEPH